MRYEICVHCDHFVESEEAGYEHLDNGMQPDYDHEAAPSGVEHSLADWKQTRPDLFVTHADGNIGPNSVHHVAQRVRSEIVMYECEKGHKWDSEYIEDVFLRCPTCGENSWVA